MSERLKGNKFWQLRTKHGRDRLFGDADLLMDEAHKYFEWCDNHPWEKTELVKYRDGYEEAPVPLGRPYTIDGLTRYLGVAGSYFRTAKHELREKVLGNKASEKETRLLETIELIEQTIRTQQIEGAAVGVFSASLVARINGIADNTNISNNGEAVVRVTVRDQETANNITELERTL